MRYVVRDGAGNEIGDIEADVKWENWQAASEYRVVVDGQNTTLNQPLAPSTLGHGFIDVYSFRLGGATRFERDGTRYELRAGVAYDTAAAPDSWTRLDVDGADRFTAAAGLGIWLGEKGGYRLDVGAAFIDSPRRNINNVSVANPDDPDGRVQPDVTVPLSGSDAPYHPFNAGTYQSRYVIGSVGLTATW
jgi:long-subunit fatty acid transport protein